jgi:hypothetical protein
LLPAPAPLVAQQVDNLVHLVERPNAAFINSTVEGHSLLLANGRKTGVSWRAHVATFETCDGRSTSVAFVELERRTAKGPETPKDPLAAHSFLPATAAAVARCPVVRRHQVCFGPPLKALRQFDALAGFDRQRPRSGSLHQHRQQAGVSHIDTDGHYYSVPYRFAREQVEVRLTGQTVEVFRKGERIAAHPRNSGNHRHTTVPEHMPSSHRRYADWTIERIRGEARLIGPSTAMLCELILEERPHPEQGFRACLGIVWLVKPFGHERVEAAATRALDIGARPYQSVKSILDNNLDRHAAPKLAADGATILHPNICGARYYH